MSAHFTWIHNTLMQPNLLSHNVQELCRSLLLAHKLLTQSLQPLLLNNCGFPGPLWSWLALLVVVHLSLHKSHILSQTVNHSPERWVATSHKMFEPAVPRFTHVVSPLLISHRCFMYVPSFGWKPWSCSTEPHGTLIANHSPVVSRDVGTIKVVCKPVEPVWYSFPQSTHTVLHPIDR